MFSKWIVFTLKIFKALGFQTVLPGTSKQQKFSPHLIFIVHISLATFATLYSKEVEYFFHTINTRMETINGMLQYYFTVATYCIAIIESYVQRKHQQRFWQVFDQINIFLENAQYKHVTLRRYLMKYFELLVFFAAFISYHCARELMCLPNAVYCSLGMLCRNKVFHLLFYIELIKFELKILENEVKQIFKINDNKDCIIILNRNANIKELDRKRFVWLQENYQILNELSEFINSQCGWSTLATVVYSFCLLLSDINWMCTYGTIIHSTYPEYIIGVGKT